MRKLYGIKNGRNKSRIWRQNDRFGYHVYCSFGKVTGIVGPNGVGKTTLLKCIAGLKKIEEGKVLIDGQDLL